MKYLILVLAIILTGCLNNEQNANHKEIDILKGYKNVKDFNLSSIVSDVNYINLENHPDAIFSYAQPIINNEFILINAYLEKKLILFKINGEYLHNIGRRGTGPGEFTNLQDVYLHPKKPLVLIHDGISSKLLIFSLEGNLQKEFHYSNRYKNPFEKAHFNANGEIQVVLRRPSTDVESFSRIRILNLEFKEINKLDFIKINENGDGGTTGFSNYWIQDYHLNFQEFYHDKIMRLEDNENKEQFKIVISEDHTPSYYVPRNPGIWDYNFIQFLTGIEDYLFMYAHLPKLDDNYVFMVYDIQENEVFRPQPASNLKLDPESWEGINNDVDGIGQVIITESYDGKIAEILNVIDLQQTLNKEDLRIEITHPKKRERLINLVINAKPEDNPIIRIFELK